MQSNKTKKAFSLLEISIVILVIGVAIAAIVKGSDVYEEYKLSSARSLTNSSVVHYVDGLTLWFDATSTQAFDEEEPADGTLVTNWHSINPNNTDKFTVTQSSGGAKPTYDVDGINGIPALRFDGGDYLDRSSTLLGDFSSSNAQTIFIVQKFDSNGAPNTHNLQTTTFSWGFSGAGVLLHFFYKDGIYYDFGSTGTTGRLQKRPIDSEDVKYKDNPIIISLKKNISNQSIRVNGNNFLSGTKNETISASVSGFFTVGAIGANYFSPYPHHRFNGKIGELIFFNRALDDEEITAIEKYLSTKWKIPLEG